jgi:hypothetical protein
MTAATRESPGGKNDHYDRQSWRHVSRDFTTERCPNLDVVSPKTSIRYDAIHGK